MKPILFYDTETTGIPDWKIPSEDPSQPHIVQLAAILADEDTQEEIASLDLIIKPCDWVIPQEVIDIHGITNEIADTAGVSEVLAVDLLMELWGGINVPRVAHNKTFDQRIIRIALKRHGDEMRTESWADKDSHLCTMRMHQQVYGGKNTKLVDAYHTATGKDLENAHSAMADTRACMEVYWSLVNRQGEAV